MKRPFVSLFFSLFFGIIFSYKFNVNTLVTISLLVAVIVLLIYYKKHDILLISMIFFILGCLLFNQHLDNKSMLAELNIEPIEVRIINDGLEKSHFSTYTEYETKVLLTEEKSLVRVYHADAISFDVGDLIKIKNFKVIPVDIEKDHIDGYFIYLKSKGIKNIIDVNQRNITYVENQSISLRSTSFRTRRFIENYFDKAFPIKEGSLLKSIIFGNRGYMPSEMITHFSRSGTAHIIAVSGLHIGLIILFLERIFKLMNIRKKHIKILTAFILLFYAFAVNFPVSIVRASMMYYLYVGAYFFEKKYDAINALMLIAFVLLLSNPFIIFSVSFQLSFSATLGILLIYPRIFETLKGVLPKRLNSLLSVTLAAQIATLPILVFHFNYLSIISIIANLLIVPVMGVLISLTLGSIILGLIPINIVSPINFIINSLLKYVFKTAEISSSSNFSGIKIEFVELYHVIIYYVIIIGSYVFLKNKKRASHLTLEE